MTSETLRTLTLTTAADHRDHVPSPRLGVALIAAAAVALELAVSARYGYVRDELYFLVAGQHLAPGYVDQPALSPLLARLATALFGDTVVGLRLIPALSLGAIVLLTAAMSRRLGAGRTGQLLAAAAAATCAQYLAVAHELTTATPDFVLWAAALYLVVRLLDSGDPRWWLAIGITVGVASAAKWNVAFLAASLAAGFVATDGRRLLRSRYLPLGCLLAAALAAPDLIWQAAHGWPAVDVFQVLQQQAGHNRATYWIAQVLFTGLALTPVWLAGLVWVLRSPALRRFRPAAIGCGLVVLLQFVLGGKAYYPGGAYSFLLAAGAVPIGSWLASRSWRGQLGSIAVLLPSAAMMVPVALPVLPARALPRCRSRRSTTIWARRSAGRPRSRWSPASTGCCPRRSAGSRRSWQAITARPAPSRGSAPPTACQPPTAGPTTSGYGARRRPGT